MRSPTMRKLMSLDGPPLPSITRALMITTPAGPGTSGGIAIEQAQLAELIDRVEGELREPDAVPELDG